MAEKTVLLSTAYLAPIAYYLQMKNHPQVIIEKYCHYVKQTYRNRCNIASANGVQTLSIPVVKPDSPKCFTKDIRIASHGNWQHVHWNAIVSAYNATPFFAYYADDFRHFYEKHSPFLFDFNEELRVLVCSLLDIAPSLSYSSAYIAQIKPDELDLREAIHPKKPMSDHYFNPYYQVFKERYGFRPNLSIIDLLFNMGPEAILFL
ncbi:MAG: WbqC family protein [Candidatus Symbiothrix sp.]|jgi:hypothetical protein|nr:WbqC family protein [Candidatus Symbiothrix sp.]